MSTGAGLGLGLYTAHSEGQGASDPYAHRVRGYRPRPPDDVLFPVAPMLDMAFQLLAFFILTFKAPSSQTHIDLDLPAAPAVSPRTLQARAAATRAAKSDADVESDLLIRAEADERGELRRLQLGEARIPDLGTLANRLRRYTRLLRGAPLRVRLLADDHLRYEPAVQIIATCTSAGVATVRLTRPGTAPRTPQPGIDSGPSATAP
jgi:biopolymer transport protein ExbD